MKAKYQVQIIAVSKLHEIPCFLCKSRMIVAVSASSQQVETNLINLTFSQLVIPRRGKVSSSK